jgi:hypothetical protein
LQREGVAEPSLFVSCLNVIDGAARDFAARLNVFGSQIGARGSEDIGDNLGGNADVASGAASLQGLEVAC